MWETVNGGCCTLTPDFTFGRRAGDIERVSYKGGSAAKREAFSCTSILSDFNF